MPRRRGAYFDSHLSDSSRARVSSYRLDLLFAHRLSRRQQCGRRWLPTIAQLDNGRAGAAAGRSTARIYQTVEL